MKKVFILLSIIVIILFMAGSVNAIPLNYVEDGSGLVPDNVWSDGELYAFLGIGISLEGGSYSLTFNLSGNVWSTPATAFGWGTDDTIYIEAILNGTSIGSTFHNGMAGQNINFSVSLDLNFDIMNSSSLLINSWSNVSYIGELWEVNNATLAGSYAPVPEPSTMILLGTGLIGLVGWRRKRFKKR